MTRAEGTVGVALAAPAWPARMQAAARCCRQRVAAVPMYSTCLRGRDRLSTFGLRAGRPGAAPDGRPRPLAGPRVVVSCRLGASRLGVTLGLAE